MLKNVSRFTTGALVAVTVLSGALLFSNNVSAEKVLRFSHTDNPGGSRQAAAEVFAKKVEEYTEGRYKIRCRFHGVSHRKLCNASAQPEPYSHAVSC